MWWKWGPSFATELGWEPFLRNRFETVFKSRDGGRLDSLLWLCPISARKEIICQDKHFFKRNRTSKRNSLVTVVPSNFFFLFSFCQIRICPTEERTGREKKRERGEENTFAGLQWGIRPAWLCLWFDVLINTTELPVPLKHPRFLQSTERRLATFPYPSLSPLPIHYILIILGWWKGYSDEQQSNKSNKKHNHKNLACTMWICGYVVLYEPWKTPPCVRSVWI